MYLIFDYHINTKQQTEIGCHHSSWKELPFGVPQGSNLRPVLFGINLCDLVLLTRQIDITSYADDTIKYTAMQMSTLRL